jgi:phenylacetate-CoA ligase
MRLGGKYNAYLSRFRENENLSLEELQNIQNSSLTHFLNYSYKNSQFYNELYQGLDISRIKSVKELIKLPIVTKEDLRSSMDTVYTISKSKGTISKTGGTTGKSLEVVFTHNNTQERFAMLDNFRSKFGYNLGKKTAWFSGKNLLSVRDVQKKRFWKTDYLNRVRYYSTYHLNKAWLKYYIQDLIRFKPLYLVGFPSNMLEIAKFGLRTDTHFPPGMIQAIFPTAETVTEETRRTIEMFFHSKIYDQYASSEGAPFIFECRNNKLHLELQSGVFEVLDNNNKPVQLGRLVVTSFTTYGTPLIRYDIGDSLELSHETCTCGNNNPLAKRILGRIDDFVYSEEFGKINLGNISNALKGTKGIIKFQVIQNELQTLTISIVIDEKEFSKKSESTFIKNWKDRVGNSMKLNINYVENISVEDSGKYRMVKNNIKHLID